MTNIARDVSHRPTGWTLNAKTALALCLTLAAAIGATTLGALWWTTTNLRQQIQSTALATSQRLANDLDATAQLSAANAIRTFDTVADDYLRAIAASVAFLIDAANDAGHQTPYINDTLRQLTARSALETIEVITPADTSSESPTSLRSLLLGPPDGRTASAPAIASTRGLVKHAAARSVNSDFLVVIQLAVDQEQAQAAYRDSTDTAARQLVNAHANTTALVLAHAIELAEDAAWERRRLETRLTAITANTTVTSIDALSPAGTTVYAANPRNDDQAVEAIANLRRQRSTGTSTLTGYYDTERRWRTRSAALRTPGRLGAAIEIAGQSGGASLIDSAWQAALDQAALDPSISGLWVTTDDNRLAAAAPRPGQRQDLDDAWSRWNDPLRLRAARAAADNEPSADAAVSIWPRATANVTTTVPIRPGTVLTMTSDATPAAARIRRDVIRGTLTAALLMVLTTGLATSLTRRWLTTPIRTIAAATAVLANGNKPPRHPRLEHRGDELGALVRNFRDMAEVVTARHDELSGLVATRTEALTTTLQQIQSDIALAQQVQQRLRPTESEIVDTVAVDCRIEPAAELAGDFILTRRDPGAMTIGVFDVAGKGIAAALFMVAARAALDDALSANDRLPSAAASVNRTLAENNDLAMFVTGILVRVDTATGNYQCVCAGHEPPILRTSRTASKLPKGAGVPLGLNPDHAYTETTGRLAPDESLVLYTDGITDACNPAGDEFTENRLQRTCRDRKTTGRQLLDHIWTTVTVFTADAQPVDDMTCAVVTRTGHTD